MKKRCMDVFDKSLKGKQNSASNSSLYSQLQFAWNNETPVLEKREKGDLHNPNRSLDRYSDPSYG